jgi:pyruvate dehydrogenase E2 component (dihydrolipoamide acetyltransferase)
MSAIEVRVPKFGMSAVEVEITEILVAVGDRVESGTALIEAASDKVDVTIEAEHGGTVDSILCEVGGTYAMGEVLLVLAPST